MAGVVVFTGHMLDRPGRPSKRFTHNMVPRVAARIAKELETLKATAGFASATCGGDILFHEAMLKRGGEVHVILPCPVGEFRKACVDYAPRGDWGRRFEDVMENADSVEILSDQCASDNAMASECSNRVTLGLGIKRASLDKAKLSVIALWNQEPGDAIGGTHSMVEYCRKHQHSVRVMNLKDLSPRRRLKLLRPFKPGVGSQPAISKKSSVLSQVICAMVFVDAVNFSKVRERGIPGFAKHYLAEVNKLLLDCESPPLERNTWGDALYAVFDSVRAAGNFALALQEFVTSTNWRKYRLPKNFNVRIALHAGPVYTFYEPIIGKWCYTGSHVTRAARLEPSTPPGQVYCSRTFAAIAAAEDVTEFRCDYVGKKDLPKKYGELPTYVIKRSKKGTRARH